MVVDLHAAICVPPVDARMSCSAVGPMKKPLRLLLIGIAMLVAVCAATVVVIVPKFKAMFAIAALSCGNAPHRIGDRYAQFPEQVWRRSLVRTMTPNDPLCSKAATLTRAPWCRVENYTQFALAPLQRLDTNVPPEPAICFTTNGLFTERPDRSGKWLFEKGGRRLVLFYTDLQYRQSWVVERLTPEQFVLCKRRASTVIFRDRYVPYEPRPSSTPDSDTGRAAAPVPP